MTNSTKTIFNGTFTITNEAGDHVTLRIRTQKADSSFAPNKRILSVLNGPDNYTNYKGFAFVNEDSTIKVWGKQNTTKNQWFAHLIAKASESFHMSETVDAETTFETHGRTYTVMLSKKCYKCNRKLTTPESIRSGIGPVCAGR
jgi:hypothetical protein